MATTTISQPHPAPVNAAVAKANGGVVVIVPGGGWGGVLGGANGSVAVDDEIVAQYDAIGAHGCRQLGNLPLAR